MDTRETIAARETDARTAIAAARTLTRDLDSKASGLLTAAGVLAAAGGLLGNTLDNTPAAISLTLAGTALIAALVALLLALAPRGDSPATWLTSPQPPGAELAKIAGIAARKHILIRFAVDALITALITGGVGITATVIGGQP